MIDNCKGCILGAVLGDALGMPNETTTARFDQHLSFGKAYRGHPNYDLEPGQYTDDGQIILIASRNLIDGNGKFNTIEYAKELLRTFELKKFRYADSSIYAACKKMQSTKNLTESGIPSDSAGCIALAIPFAIAYHNRKEMAKDLYEACCITQIHSGIHAAAIGLALCLNTLLETNDFNAAIDDLLTAAKNMDEELYIKLNEAIKSEENKLPIDAAVSFIGNTASIYHTLPMAIFITKRAYIPTDVLSAASHIGGNSDTISMICGALIGARFGIESLPAELLTKLERAGIFYEIAEKLFLIRNKNAGDAAENADIKNEDRSADKAE